MRTTLRIDDDLLHELKTRAASVGLSLSELVIVVLRQSVAAPPRPRRPFRQKTRNLGRPAFDVSKANAVAADLEDEAILHKVGRSA
jgi:antitoxin component of RelBE/YafQ-DinJ toxin-antitoxin module